MGRAARLRKVMSFERISFEPVGDKGLVSGQYPPRCCGPARALPLSGYSGHTRKRRQRLIHKSTGSASLALTSCAYFSGGAPRSPGVCAQTNCIRQSPAQRPQEAGLNAPTPESPATAQATANSRASATSRFASSDRPACHCLRLEEGRRLRALRRQRKRTKGSRAPHRPHAVRRAQAPPARCGA